MINRVVPSGFVTGNHFLDLIPAPSTSGQAIEPLAISGIDLMSVDHSYRLHEGVCDYRSAKLEAFGFQIFGEGFAFG